MSTLELGLKAWTKVHSNQLSIMNVMKLTDSVGKEQMQCRSRVLIELNVEKRGVIVWLSRSRNIAFWHIDLTILCILHRKKWVKNVKSFFLFVQMQRTSSILRYKRKLYLSIGIRFYYSFSYNIRAGEKKRKNKN